MLALCSHLEVKILTVILGIDDAKSLHALPCLNYQHEQLYSGLKKFSM